jgi:hypothetical protein
MTSSGADDDKTSYDPGLPGKIRQELGAREASQPREEAPGVRAPSRGRFMLMALPVLVAAILVIQKGWIPGFPKHSSASGDLGTARGHLASRDWDRVIGDLEPLRAAGTLGQEGRLLDDTARGMLRLEAARRDGDWLTAYDVALGLDRLWREDGALKLEIGRLLDRSRTEVLAGQKLAEGRDLLAAARLPEALEALAGVPSGTACAEAAAAEAARAREALRARTLADATRAADNARWEEAARLLAPLAPPDPALAARIARGSSQAEALCRSEALLAALRVDEAAAALEGVDTQGPCAEARADLSARIARTRGLAVHVAQARDRFDLGEGEEALAILSRQAGGALPGDLKEGIARTVSAYQRILEALDRKDDLAALEAVRALCAMPLAPENWYRARAEAARGALERKVAALAEQAVARGVDAFRECRYREARDAFDLARRGAPDHPVVAVYQRRFIEVGEDLYRDGYVLKALDPAAAKARFEKALACLPPDHPTAAKARESLP